MSLPPSLYIKQNKFPDNRLMQGITEHGQQTWRELTFSSVSKSNLRQVSSISQENVRQIWGISHAYLKKNLKIQMFAYHKHILGLFQANGDRFQTYLFSILTLFWSLSSPKKSWIIQWFSNFLFFVCIQIEFWLFDRQF